MRVITLLTNCKSVLVGSGYTLTIRLAIKEFSRANAPILAAGIAYFGLFSLFPLSLAFIAIASFFLGNEKEQLDVVNEIHGLIPVSTEYLSDNIETIVRNRGPISLIGLLGLLWSGLAVFAAIRKGINQAWGISAQPNLFKKRFIDFGILIGLGLAATVVLLLSAKLFEIPWVGDWRLGIDGAGMTKMFISVISFMVTIIVVLALYKYVPHRTILWKDIWASAILTAVLLESGRHVFSLYVTHFAGFNLVYGSLGAIMAILAWIYLSANIVLFGAYMASAYCRVKGSDSDLLLFNNDLVGNP